MFKINGSYLIALHKLIPKSDSENENAAETLFTQWQKHTISG